MRKHNFLMLIGISIFTFLFFTTPLSARKMSDEEVGCILLKNSIQISYTNDGTSTQNGVQEFQILHQSAIDEFSKFEITYDVFVDTVPTLKAWIQTPEGEIIQVQEKDIVDESLANNDVGFNQRRTRYFPWPKLTVGTIMHVEYAITTKPEYPNTFSNRFSLSTGLAVKEYEFILKIPKFVTSQLQDSQNVMRSYLQETITDNKKTIRVIAKNLPNTYYTQETQTLIPNELKVWLDISTFSSWQDAGSIKADGYNAVLNQPLPPELIKLFGEKPTQPLSQDQALQQLTQIMNTLIDNIRYFQDYRRVKGGFVPRDLAEIVRTGYGDCKDYATLVVLAARHLGLEAYPAVTFRGSTIPLPPQLPMSMAWTNHAIAYVISPNKDIWWTDATNKRSPLGIIPNDLADRDALVLSPTAQLQHIPAIDPKINRYSMEWEYDLAQSPNLIYKLAMDFTQTLGWNEYKQTFNMPKDILRDYLVNWVGAKSTDIENYEVLDFKFNDTAPFDYKAHIRFLERSAIARSGNYKILDTGLLPAAADAITKLNSLDRVTDLNLGELKTTQTSLKLKSFKSVIAKPFVCDLQSPWYDFKRENISSSWWGSDYELRTTSVVKNQRVTLSEMQSAEFKKLQTDLTACTRNVSIIAE